MCSSTGESDAAETECIVPHQLFLSRDATADDFRFFNCRGSANIPCKDLSPLLEDLTKAQELHSFKPSDVYLFPDSDLYVT